MEACSKNNCWNPLSEKDVAPLAGLSWTARAPSRQKHDALTWPTNAIYAKPIFGVNRVIRICRRDFRSCIVYALSNWATVVSLYQRLQ